MCHSQDNTDTAQAPKKASGKSPFSPSSHSAFTGLQRTCEERRNRFAVVIVPREVLGRLTRMKEALLQELPQGTKDAEVDDLLGVQVEAGNSSLAQNKRLG
jgi:hypothetical protein